ncbi:MAG: ribbon-helix-helix protein, CopG family [Gammaproteobacteria bacterium]|nr:ribbon-helix-helix protein, CopG family [Gammaproteobacteria bacterium]
MRRTEMTLRLTQSEKSTLEELARVRGTTLAEAVREAIAAAAKRAKVS